MENIIIILLLAVIAGAVLWYLLRQKKSGAKCVGCPYAKNCGSKCSCSERSMTGQTE